ncbi:MAG: site-2 protease family protein [Acidimicrobiaceae bacterium]|nr:site-2 protease family protein [Acidimicrobiaceae bacterium]
MKLLSSALEQRQSADPAKNADDFSARSRRMSGRINFVLFLIFLGWIGLQFGGLWLLVICALIFMVLMHELGHYLTARWVGMKVTEFFLGFGPRLWSFRYKEVDYGVKPLWFGAYVRIVGMNNLEQVAPEDESRSFRNKSYPRKLLVLVAGSGMHFLMAFALLFMLFLMGGVSVDSASRQDEWTIGHVVPNSTAHEIGLKTGDKVVSVDGTSIGLYDDFSTQVASKSKGEEVELVYLRNGVEHVAAAEMGERLTVEGADGFAGLIEGDQLLTVKGLETDGLPSYAEVVDYALSQPDQLIEVNLRNTQMGGELVAEVKLTEVVDASEATEGYFGISAVYSFSGANPFVAGVESAKILFELIKNVSLAIPKVFSQGLLELVKSISGNAEVPEPSDLFMQLSPDEIEVQRLAEAANPTNPNENRLISIYGVARLGVDSAVSGGMIGLMTLMMLVNVFIGVFNLLPILPLDGGHVMVATYERIRSIRGGPYHVDASKLIPLTYIMIGILLFIGVATLVRDIVDPLSFS